MNANHKNPLLTYCLRLGDTSLVLGQRLGEWCGHGPIIEEDIALTNISLDLIGQARAFIPMPAKSKVLENLKMITRSFVMKGSIIIFFLRSNPMEILDKQSFVSFC